MGAGTETHMDIIFPPGEGYLFGRKRLKSYQAHRVIT